MKSAEEHQNQEGVEAAVQTDMGAEFFEDIDLEGQSINETGGGIQLNKKALRTPGVAGLKGSASITNLRTENSSTALGTHKGQDNDVSYGDEESRGVESRGLTHNESIKELGL